MDAKDQLVVESVYHETAAEALARGDTPLTAHKEAVIAASILLSSLTGVENEPAKKAIVALGLKPPNGLT